MPKCKVVLLSEARFQLRDIAMIHKAQVDPNAARKITNRILTSLERLEEFPEMGVIPHSEMLEKAGYRMLIVGDYLCFYSREGDTIFVNQILHGSVDYVIWLLR